MAVTFYFLVNKIISFDVDYSYILQPMVIIKMIVMVLIMTIAISGWSLNWKWILEFLAKQSVNKNESFTVFAKSNLGKYLPGNVMQYANRNIYGNKLGLSQIQLAISSVIELGLQGISAIFVGMILSREVLRKYLWEYGGNFFLQHALILSLVLVLVSVVLISIIFVKRKQVKSLLGQYINKSMIILATKVVFIDILALLVQGALLAYVISWFVSISSANVLLVISSFAVAWFVGFVVPGAPGGIGIREAMLTILLGDVCSTSIILLAIIIHRIVSIFADVMLFAIGVLIAQKKNG